MRFEVKNLQELRDAMWLLDGGCRLSFHTDKGVVAVRVNDNDIWLHEVPEHWTPEPPKEK